MIDETIRVMLIDDQEIISQGIQAMLAHDPLVQFHYCSDPTHAIDEATLFKPTVILQDLVMPEMDGLTLVKYLKADDFTKHVPLIVLSSKEEPTIKAQAFSLGANDYLVKLPDQQELLARIHYHSNSYLRLIQRNEAMRKLQEELDEAAEYVKGILPPFLAEKRVQTRWQFIPSTILGGDVFGYEWLDKDHLSMYLLDVCGHGVGAALLSISIMNALRGQTLPGTNFYAPASVLHALNQAFPMEEHRDMFFTIWYGVIDFQEKELGYASGGHPPQLLYLQEDPNQLVELKTEGVAIGVDPNSTYQNQTIKLDTSNRLFLFSDGTFEITDSGGTMISFNQFKEMLTQSLHAPQGTLPAMLNHVIKLEGNPPFVDDYSFVEFMIRP